MALSRTPGPVGFRVDSRATDPGLLARIPRTPAGPVGLQIKLPVFMAPKVAKVTASRQLGITVHPAAQISAQDWVKKINDSGDVPDYFKEQIKSKGNVIFVTNPKKFRFPKNVIAKDWLTDWLSAFVVADWEMTTGCLDFSVKKGDAAGPIITIVHNPDLSSGETIGGFTKHTMTVTSRSTSSIMIERGNTLPTGVTLNTGLKLIAVANRIALSLGGKTRILKFEESELVETWFHEIACHAGRNSAGKPDVHGDKEVDSFASDIRDMFPKTTTVPKVFDEIQAFLK